MSKINDLVRNIELIEEPVIKIINELNSKILYR